jgi:hypothetical protein
MRTLRIAGFVTVIVALAGCETSAVEDDFGNSVAHMIESQKAHPEVSANPDPDVVDGTDAYRAEQVLDTFRGDVSKPEEVSKGVVISIGDR